MILCSWCKSLNKGNFVHLATLSLHLSWTQFGCDNDAVCLPLQDLTITSPNHNGARSWYYSVRFEWPGAAEQLWPHRHISNFPPAFQIFSGRFGIRPPGPLCKHIEDFILPSVPITLLNCSVQWGSCVNLVMDPLHYLTLVKLFYNKKDKSEGVTHHRYVEHTRNIAGLLNYWQFNENIR